MAGNIKFDTRDLDRGLEALAGKVKGMQIKAVNRVADEVLRLSSFEVPHDTGMLQSSGHVEPQGDEAIVGYNKVYAARLHEHPEYNFQKGRKGRYLFDPIRNNLGIFRKYIQEVVNSALS